MLDGFRPFFESLSSRRTALLVAGALLAVVLVALQNVGAFPLDAADFAFFAVLAFLVALYRPGWMFLVFVSLLPLETVDVAPAELGLSLRPYQLAGGAALAALALRAFSGKLSFRLSKPSWRDWLVVFLVAGGFLAAAGSPDKSQAFKQAVVVLSFGAIYWLSRQFLRGVADLRAALPFFLSSGALVSLYAAWQNGRFVRGLQAFESMPGRANAAFAEPDWLGMYLVATVGLLYGLLFYLDRERDVGAASSGGVAGPKTDGSRIVGRLFLHVLLVLSYVALILTVARSAWLGTALATALFIKASVTHGSWKPAEWRWRNGLRQGVGIAACGLVAAGVVSALHLTTFQLDNRIQSTASGLQRITVACDDGDAGLPERIGDVSELGRYGCRHIDLEAVGRERASGKAVFETYRNDPNVDIRKRIYAAVFGIVAEHPVLGIGWGGVSRYLGTDDRGTGLNASNAFLEAWLGSGLAGAAAFSILWFSLLVGAVRNFLRPKNDEVRALALSIVLSGAGMTVFNLFNSGILLGFVWVWMAAASALPGRKERSGPGRFRVLAR
jgi:hypothetical protein